MFFLLYSISSSFFLVYAIPGWRTFSLLHLSSGVLFPPVLTFFLLASPSCLLFLYIGLLRAKKKARVICVSGRICGLLVPRPRRYRPLLLVDESTIRCLCVRVNARVNLTSYIDTLPSFGFVHDFPHLFLREHGSLKICGCSYRFFFFCLFLRQITAYFVLIARCSRSCLSPAESGWLLLRFN